MGIKVFFQVIIYRNIIGGAGIQYNSRQAKGHPTDHGGKICAKVRLQRAQPDILVREGLWLCQRSLILGLSWGVFKGFMAK
jgi:hypothetical protein